MLNFKKWMAEIGIPFTMAGPCGPESDPEGLSRAMPNVNPDEMPPTFAQRSKRMKKMRRK
jgi:hypothetical protein